MATLPGILLVVALAGPSQEEPVAQPVDGPTYAAFPIRDMVGERDVVKRLQALLWDVLRGRGAVFTSQDQLEQVLFARRIRYTDSVSATDAQAIADTTGAQFLITGALLDYAPGPDPKVSLAVRVLDLEEGERIQSALVNLRGEDFRGLFALGAIEDPRELELEVVARIVEDFDETARPLVIEPSPKALSKERPGDALGFFVDEAFDPAFVTRVAVMPLVNGTRRPDAGIQFAEILGHELFRFGGVEVVELSELRAALIRARVRSLDFLDREIYSQVGRELGTRYFVLGRLDLYAEGVLRTEGAYPEVEASVRVLDVETGRIVAAAAVRRRGNDYETVLGLGVVHDLLQLADRTAKEIVALILG